MEQDDLIIPEPPPEGFHYSTHYPSGRIVLRPNKKEAAKEAASKPSTALAVEPERPL